MVSKAEREKQKKERVGVIRKNNQGCLMKVVEYIDSKHIFIEFQDEHKERHNATWQQFLHGEIKNNFCENKTKNGIQNNHELIYGIGEKGNKYPIRINGEKLKEYILWSKMLERCYSDKMKERNPTYKDVTCSKEFLSYTFFYEWLHKQENWEYLNENNIHYNLDKDILIKGNKIYSPNTCCLVPQNVNGLFIKRNKSRGALPIGVTKNREGFCAQWSDNKGGKHRSKTVYSIEEAFIIYKTEKEKIIKQVAQEEYEKGTITKKCYDAMINYQVEITD